MEELGQLFRKAREYGRVFILTSNKGKYSCVIEFNFVDIEPLEVKSGYGCETPEIAVTKAIEAAEKIVSNIMNEPIIKSKLKDKHHD